MGYARQDDSVSFKDYLAGEREVEIRSEYIGGYVYAMAGASELHNTVASTFAGIIENALPDSYRSWQSDMKVIGKNKNFDQFFSYYPDIMASCEKNDSNDPYARSNPNLIVEVLSPSTQRTDLKEKFDNYISIPSLLEYVAVSQDTPYVRVFRRSNNWQSESYYKDDSFHLDSANMDITVRQIYRRVKMEVGLEVNITKNNC